MHRMQDDSEDYRVSSCRSLDIHSRLDRDVARRWLSGGQLAALDMAELTPTHLGRGLVGLEVSQIESRSLFEEVGLKNGDLIATIEGIPLFSANSERLLREKLDSAETPSVSMALLRHQCPAFLEIHLI